MVVKQHFSLAAIGFSCLLAARAPVRCIAQEPVNPEQQPVQQQPVQPDAQRQKEIIQGASRRLLGDKGLRINLPKPGIPRVFVDGAGVNAIRYASIATNQDASGGLRLSLRVATGNRPASALVELSDDVRQKRKDYAETLVAGLAETCEFSPAQSSKIRLAAEAEARSIMRRVGARLEVKLKLSLSDQRAVRDILTELSSLNSELDEILADENSLLMKVITGLVTDEQRLLLHSAHLSSLLTAKVTMHLSGAENEALWHMLEDRAAEIPTCIHAPRLYACLAESITDDELASVLSDPQKVETIRALLLGVKTARVEKGQR